MDESSDSQELIDNVNLVPVTNFRSEVVKLNTGNNGMKETEGDHPPELIYININRVSNSLSKELTDCNSPTPVGLMTGELMQHHVAHGDMVVDLMGNQGPPPTDYSQHALDRTPLPQYISDHYETTEDLLPQDLTEEDRRLAAALVAVQLVQQQKQQQQHQQQHTIVTAESNVIVSPGGTPRLIASVGHLGNKIPVSLPDQHQMTALTPLSPEDKPAMAAMVSSYIQSVEEEVAANHHPHTHSERLGLLKMYHPQPHHQELRLPPLAPLKKVASNHSVGVRNQYLREPHLQDAAGYHSQLLRQTGPIRAQELGLVKEEGDFSFDVKSEGLLFEEESDEAPLDDNDSDYDIENDLKSSRRSLPHKKRIPRKLKNLKNSPPPSKNMPVKLFKCVKCGEQFDSLVNLSSHKLTHSPGKKSFNCDICHKNFAQQLKFFEHLKCHYEPSNNGAELNQGKVSRDANVIKETPQVHEELAGTPPLACSLCGKTFRRQKALETHVTLTHPKVEPMEEFSEPEDLMEGIRGVVDVGGGETGDEGDMDGLPLAPRSLKMHDKDWYPDEELHAAEEDLRELEQQQQDTTCEICGEVFEDKYQVNEHVREAHLQMKDEIKDLIPKGGRKRPRRPGVHLSCPQCGRMFNHRNSLVYHMRSHSGERPHQCEVCGKSFFAASALKVHMRLHSGDKPYKCEFCGRHFRQWGDLKYHCISIHSEEKNYQCEYCGKDFARKYSLIVHRRIHTGEKNYKCEFCEKSFRASSYLQNHRRIHTGEKPHPCEVCGKPFRVRSDMKRHLNTHTRDRQRASDTQGTRGERQRDLLHDTKVEEQESEQLPPSLHDLDPVEITVHHDGSGPESILPDESLGDLAREPRPVDPSRQPAAQLAAQVSEDVLHYARDPLETVREGNTLYVWPIYMT